MPFMKPYMVKLLREQFPPGTRVRLESEMNDPQPIPTGMTGTVQGIDDAGQLLMKWDNGRGLSLVPGEDDFSVVKPQKLKLYMPLELGYYEKNDWGDYGDEELALSDNDAVGYADTITGALERESKFLDTHAASWNTITEATALTQRCSRSISKPRHETANSGA